MLRMVGAEMPDKDQLTLFGKGPTADRTASPLVARSPLFGVLPSEPSTTLRRSHLRGRIPAQL